jgi:LacI family transcriptional regulator
MSQAHWQRIAEHFREQIESGTLVPGTRIPSDARLAEEWSVSRPTAHRALHELQRLGLVLRSKSMGTVVAPPVAKATGRLAFIVDRLVPQYNFPHSDLMRGIQDGMGEEGSLVMAQCDDDYRREARQLERLAQEVDGIIIYPTCDPRNNGLMQRLFETGTPLVVLDRYPEGLNVDTVVSDNVDATGAAIRHLMSRGHSRIGFFSFYKPDFSSVNERFEAYREAMAAGGVEDVTPFVRWFSQAVESQPRLLSQAMQDALFALREKQGMTAVFCVEDIVAAGVMEGADALGMRVPDDLELAFFNDWPPMVLRSPWTLHRVNQNPYLLGRTAARIVHDRFIRTTNGG